VKLLGFIPDDTFWALLESSDLIMDLTLREGCLVCGAYEGVALLKPLVLSDTKALRSYFSEGCVYVAPDAESIAEGIHKAIENIGELRSGILRLKERLENSWKATMEELEMTLESIGATAR
jgi:glycosyltransferase involved in cell wall biosynthesis